jgi:hypothetical protein
MRAHMIELTEEEREKLGLSVRVITCQYDDGTYSHAQNITLGVDEIKDIVILMPCRNCMDALSASLMGEIVRDAVSKSLRTTAKYAAKDVPIGIKVK